MCSSDPGFPRFFVLLALWVLGAACSSGPGSEYDPRPQRLVPVWGLNSAPVPVVIEGENFLALVTQHIGGPEPVSEDARFEAFLGEVALEDVTLEDEHTLRARVPEGLAPGWHTLTVTGPLGQHAELPRAYLSSERPLARLEAEARLQRNHVWVGERTQLTVTVENTGGTVALGVTPVLNLAGEGRVVVSSEPAPADIAPGTRVSFVWGLDAVASGALSVTVEARGREETTGMELPVLTAEAGPLELREHPALTAVLTSSSQVVNVGQRFELTLEVRNTGDTRVRDVRPHGIVSGCDGKVSLASAPNPEVGDVPARGRLFFRARLVGTGEGTCVFRVDVRGTEETEGTPVVAPSAESTVRVKRPAT